MGPAALALWGGDTAPRAGVPPGTHPCPRVWDLELGQPLKVEIWLTFWNGAKGVADLGWELAPCLAAVGQPVWAAR